MSAVGDPISFAEDVVVDDCVEFLVGLVAVREFVLPTVRAVSRRSPLIAMVISPPDSPSR